MIWQKLSKITLKSWLFYIHGGYIWYVKGCKFSTSTHENYRIKKNIVSALCGYFYGSWGPKTHSEIVHISKNVLKTLKHMPKSATLVGGCHDISPHFIWTIKFYRLDICGLCSQYRHIGHILGIYRLYISINIVPINNIRIDFISIKYWPIYIVYRQYIDIDYIYCHIYSWYRTVSNDQQPEKLTLLSQNLVQQTEQKRYFLIERYKRKTLFSPTKLSPTFHRITTKQPFSLILDVFGGKKALFRNK